ncbi:MAG: TIM44-like domain-containing protein [Ruminococcus sp.]|nr:TIM44-like domain-containing protein [Ruminococcus sp.]
MVKNKLNNINSYMAKEPDFSPSEFKEKVANLYIRLQNCIEDKNVEELTPYLTEDMINSLKDMIADLKQKG